MHSLTLFCVLVSCFSFGTSVFCPLEWPSCGLVIQNIVCERGGSCPPVEGCENVESDPEFLKWILHEHNRLRNEIATGRETRGYTGAAANMMALSYDKKLEYTASCNANRCKFQHDKCRGTKKFPAAGQNLFYASGNQSELRKAVKGWFEEITLNTPDVISKYPRGREDISRFTQLIWATTTHIGCAQSRNPKTNEYFLVCNYGPEGNLPDQMVYERGTSCSKCPDGTECNEQYPGLCGKIDAASIEEPEIIKTVEKDRPPLLVLGQSVDEDAARGDVPSMPIPAGDDAAPPAAPAEPAASEMPSSVNTEAVPAAGVVPAVGDVPQLPETAALPPGVGADAKNLPALVGEAGKDAVPSVVAENKPSGGEEEKSATSGDSTKKLEETTEVTTNSNLLKKIVNVEEAKETVGNFTKQLVDYVDSEQFNKTISNYTDGFMNIFDTRNYTYNNAVGFVNFELFFYSLFTTLFVYLF